jgi:hypothetical protein
MPPLISLLLKSEIYSDWTRNTRQLSTVSENWSENWFGLESHCRLSSSSSAQLSIILENTAWLDCLVRGHPCCNRTVFFFLRAHPSSHFRATASDHFVSERILGPIALSDFSSPNLNDANSGASPKEAHRRAFALPAPPTTSYRITPTGALLKPADM